MRQPFIILLLWLLITPFATSNYTVQMTVILASMDVSAFAPLQLAFRRAIASTAQVDISAVSVNSYSNHVTSSSFRRLLSFRHLLSTSTEVSFFIQATDYQTASAIGIRLKPVYMTEDLTSEGLPPATILSGPLFLGHDANLLTCAGCPDGQYLDGACRECPDFSSTQPRINAADITFCVCEPGYTNSTSDTCSVCGIGLFKPELDNVTCTSCPVNMNTVEQNAHSLEQCLCDPGYHRATAAYTLLGQGGVYKLVGDSVSNPTLQLTRGRQTVVTWPNSAQQGYHPFWVSEFPGHGATQSTLATVGNGITTINVPSDFQGSLYYYCQLHGGMVGTMTVKGPEATATYTLIGQGGVYKLVGDSVSNPTLQLTRGRQTVVTWPNSAQQGYHPFWVSEFPGHGAAQSTLATVGNGITTINVPSDFQGSLYYYCQLHGGMVGTMTIGDPVCTVCAGGTYKHALGDEACTECPVNSDSDDNADALTDCTCNLGYIGPAGGPCVACVAGKYRSDVNTNICVGCPVGKYNELDASFDVGDCQQCPTNTNTYSDGSGSSLDCVCNAGYEASRNNGDDSYTCTACAAGFYSLASNSSACAACGSGTYSTATAATTANVCTECPDGQYNVDTGKSECSLCPTSTWQDLFAPNTKANPCEACPTNSSHSELGTVDIHDCVCHAGYYKVQNTFGRRLLTITVFTCEVCLAGDFCPGDNSITDCPVNHWSYAGSAQCTECAANSQGIVSQGLTTPEQCQCIAGFEGNYDNLCTECPTGMFQELDYTYDTLQLNLRAGITEDSPAVPVTCQYCPEDTFCHLLGSNVCFDCPANSESGVGSDEQTDCVCKAGFVGPNGGPCEPCPVGFFCPGGTQATLCRLNSNSTIGVSTQAECLCNPGWYSVGAGTNCRKCEPDKYCPGDQALISCANNSFSPPGAASASACWCNEGMWRGCITLENGTRLDSTGAPCDIDYGLDCFSCGPNDICVNETLQHCPEHSVAPAGSHDPDACTCVDGYYNVPHDADDHDHHDGHDDDDHDH